MADPFDSSRRKIARAKEHLANLEGKVKEFVLSDPYARVVEPHPDKPEYFIHKIKLTKPLPSSFADIAGEMAQALRNALDNAGYAVAIASGCINPKFTAFPFAGSVAQMANTLGRSKDIPQQIQSLFCGFQPYPGGDDLLWALNEICVTDKHKMLVPIGTAILRYGANVHGTGFMSMPDRTFGTRKKRDGTYYSWTPHRIQLRVQFPHFYSV